MSDSIRLALDAVERVPEHDLRRLLERMAVTNPTLVRIAVDRLFAFDAITRSTRADPQGSDG